MIDQNGNILAKSGIKKTKARIAVLDALQAAVQPMAAEDIFDKVRKCGLSVNLSTIYRTLDLLHSVGLIEKTIISSNKSVFELAGTHHKHHLICTGCSKRVSVEYCPFEKIERQVGKETNFDITGHRLELYGLCPDCKKVKS